MAQPLRITTPFPSFEETARRAGVPAPRAKQLLDMAEGIAMESRALRKAPLSKTANKKSSAKRVAGKKH